MTQKSGIGLLQNILFAFSLIMFVFFIVYLHVYGNIRTPLANPEYYQRGLPKEERIKLGF